MEEFLQSLEIDPVLLELFKESVIAIFIGLLLGLEREFSRDRKEGRTRPGGVRTFPIVALAGYLALYLSERYFPWVYLSVAIGVIGIILISYLRSSKQADKAAGTTTEFSLIATFLLGSVVFTKEYQLAVALAVIITALLAFKIRLHEAVHRLSQNDIGSILIFIVITALILPLLPNEDYGIYGVFNPFRIWLVVAVFISLNFGAYFLGKFISSRNSVWITGLIGGFVSSTATTWYLSRESAKNEEGDEVYASSISLAATIMFPKIMLWLAFFHGSLLGELWYYLLFITIIGVVISYRLWRKSRKGGGVEREIRNPVNIKDALIFAAVFVIIELFVGWAREEFGNLGIYFASGIAGLMNVDAITLSLANSTRAGLGLSIGATAVMLAAVANTLTKYLFCLIFGGGRLRRISSVAFLPLLVAGLLVVGWFLLF